MFADRQGEAAQLLVGCLLGDGQFAAFATTLETLPAAAVVFEQGVADQGSEGGEGKLVGIAGAAVLLKQVVERGGRTLPLPQQQHGLGQRQAVQDFRCKSCVALRISWGSVRPRRCSWH